MSFFDEVETTVANTRFLQACDDNAKVDLQLKPIAELAELEAKIRGSINILDFLKSETTCFWLFCKFLKQEKHPSFVAFLEQLQPYKKASRKKRRLLAEETFAKHLDPSTPPEDGSMGPVPTTTGKGSIIGKKSVVDEKPIVNLARFLASDHQDVLDATKKKLDSGSSAVWDDVVSVLVKYFETKKDAFMSSDLFTQEVQLRDYAKKPAQYADFRVFRVLGRGAFGAVSAVQKIDTHEVFAMKEMDKKKVKAERMENMCIAEKKVLSKMQSPFVLGLDYAITNEDSLFLIFPVLGGGDLKFHLRNEPDRCFSPARAKFYVAETLLGLEHIHSFDIVYRDLKPNNIILNQEGHVVVSDLGLCIQLRKDKLIKHLAGTAGYWAPEILSKQGTYKVSDFWSLAVMLYEMLTGRRPETKSNKKNKEWSPFGMSTENEENALLNKEGCCKIGPAYPPDKIEPDARDLLELLFEADPTKRIGKGGAKEIMAHKWFKEYDWDALAKMEMVPPYIPDNRTVHAESIGEVGQMDNNKFKKTKLTEEDDKIYESFHFSNPKSVQRELVAALVKMDAPAQPVEVTEAASGCCTIL